MGTTASLIKEGTTWKGKGKGKREGEEERRQGWVYNTSSAKKNTSLSKHWKWYLASFLVVQKMAERQRQGPESILPAARKYWQCTQILGFKSAKQMNCY